MAQLGTSLRSDMARLGVELRSEMDQLGTSLRSDMAQLQVLGLRMQIVEASVEHLDSSLRVEMARQGQRLEHTGRRTHFAEQ